MRGWLGWSIQIAVAGVVAVRVWRAIAHNWDEFRSLHVALALKPGWIALATLVVFAAYAMQIESWRRVLAGWAQRLPYGRAARIWLLVNLGRYVPGKLWRDRKSTRLNSSHVAISYAVFCLKKKKKKDTKKVQEL